MTESEPVLDNSSGLAMRVFEAACIVVAVGLIALLVAVFPANIHMARHAELSPTIPPAVLWVRLPLQGVLILWAYWFTYRR